LSALKTLAEAQMAEAFAKIYGDGKIIASSAGNKPADKINPVVVEVMREKGRYFLKQAKIDNFSDGA
jgi:protein-tyrosine-phosphatase